jgi:hypothetical protein
MLPTLNGVVDADGPFELVKGRQLGTGAARTVYEFEGYPDLVIKESRVHPHMQNCTEWRVWCEIAGDHGWNGRVGRCEAISRSGRFLVMERLDDVTTDEQRERRELLYWVHEWRPSAFGVNSAGVVKTRDYGLAAPGPYPQPKFREYLTIKMEHCPWP